MKNKEKQSTPRVRKLETASDCRRELAKVYRLGRHNEIATQDMTRFASVLQILINAIRDGDLEARLQELEEQFASNNGTPARSGNGYSKRH